MGKYVVSQVTKHPAEMSDEEFMMTIARHQQFPTAVTSFAYIPIDLYCELGRRYEMARFDPSI